MTTSVDELLIRSVNFAGEHDVAGVDALAGRCDVMWAPGAALFFKGKEDFR